MLHGVKTDDTKSHIELAVKMSPDYKLIQCGTNNLKGMIHTQLKKIFHTWLNKVSEKIANNTLVAAVSP